MLIGFLVGDGFYYKKRRRKNYVVGFHQKRREIAEIYKDLLGKVFGRKPVEEKAPHGIIKVYIYSKFAYEFLRDIKSNAVLYFDTLPPEEKVKFIGGFIDAEGLVRHDRIIMYNTDKELLLGIMDFLAKYGVRSTIHHHHGCYELHIWQRSSRNTVMSLCKAFSVKIASLSSSSFSS